MKTAWIGIGVVAAICAALIWAGLHGGGKSESKPASESELKPTVASEFKPAVEAECCARLKSADARERMKAYRELGKLWERQWPDWSDYRAAAPRYGTATEPDELIRAAMEALRAEQDADATVVGAGTLSLAPPSRVQVPWIENLLREVAAKSSSQWVKQWCALDIKKLYWRQGLAPSEAAMEMINDTLTTCREPQTLYYFLLYIQDMYSDLRPLKKTLEFLLLHYDRKVNEAAKQALDNMNLPITPEDRRDRCRVQVM